MKCLLSVSLATLVVAANFYLTSPAQTPELRQGVSVQMAATTHAAPYTAADDADAWIVAVTSDGKLYFGTKFVTPEQLMEEMKSHPRRREQKLYIKADARAPFGDVEQVLEAGRAAFFEAPVLLTSQSESPAPGTVVPPKGLEVLVGSPAASDAIVVQVSDDGRQGATVKINNQQISSAALPNTLVQLLQHRSEKAVVLKADGRLPSADVVQVIDACRAAGAKIVLAAPSL
jgi:biopolymer transport protein ExbD